MRSDDSLEALAEGATNDTADTDNLFRQEVGEYIHPENEIWKLAMIVKNSRELVSMADLDGRMIFLNEAASRVLGISREEVSLHSIYDVIPEKCQKIARSVMSTILEKSSWEGDLQYRNLETGNLTDMNAMLFMIREPGKDKPLCLANVSLDITERKRMENELRSRHENLEELVKERTAELEKKNSMLADEIAGWKRTEKALRESEERFRMIAETIVEVFWILDVNMRRVFYASPGYERICGRSLASLYEDPRSFIDSIHEQDRKQVLTNYKNNKKGKPFDHEYRIIRPDGTICWVWGRGFPVSDETGKVIRYVGVTRDITQRKQMEEELKNHRVHLEDLVNERTSELTKANEHLRHEIEVRKRFETELISRENELEEKRSALEDMNTALRVLLNQRNADKKHLEENILSNIKTFVCPYIERLKTSGLTEEQKKLLSEIELHLEDLTSSLVRELSSDYIGLSPIEIRVASLVREGKSSKEIAKALNISLNTVLTHRYSIRKKTGLNGRKVNLIAYLQTLKQKPS